MTHDEARTTILQVLAGVAPEADASTLDPHASIQDQLDIDSLDCLNVIMGVHKATGIDIPERDYPKVATLDGWVGYLVDHAPEAHPA